MGLRSGTTIIIAIAGLPGSGKTFLGRRLAKRLRRLHVSDPYCGHGSIWTKLHAREWGEDCVVDDPQLTSAARREEFESWVAGPVRWVFFENDPVACCLNIARNALDDPGHPTRTRLNALGVYGDRYTLPAGVRTRPVYRHPGDAQAIVDKFIDHLPDYEGFLNRWGLYRSGTGV